MLFIPVVKLDPKDSAKALHVENLKMENDVGEHPEKLT